MAKKNNNKLAWAIGLTLTGLLLFGDKIKSSLGISGTSQDDYDRLKIAVDLGLFKENKDYEVRDVMKASRKFSELRNRKAGPDREEQLNFVIQEINAGGGFIFDTCDWLLYGNYGSEWTHYFNSLMNNLNTSGEKRIKNSVTMIAKMLIQAAILLENSDLNMGQLAKVWKKVDPIANAKFVDRVVDLIVQTYLEKAEYFKTYNS